MSLLIAIGDRFEREERFARLVHRLDVLLVTSRRTGATKPAVANLYCNGLDPNTEGLYGRVNVSNPSLVVPSNTGDASADNDIAAARDTSASEITNGGVGVASYVGTERQIADSIVSKAGGVDPERTTAMGIVEGAARIAIERTTTKGVVKGAGRVAQERLITGGHVVVTDAVGQERLPAGRSVVGAGGVLIERARANASVVVAGGVFKERSSTYPGEVVAGGVIKEDSKTNCHIGISGIVEESLGPNRHVEGTVDIGFPAPENQTPRCNRRR